MKYLNSLIDIEVGDILQHVVCKYKREVVYKSRDYVVLESGDYPQIVLGDNIGIFKKLPRTVGDIPLMVLERAYRIARTGKKSTKDFRLILEQCMQDYKESTLP